VSTQEDRFFLLCRHSKSHEAMNPTKPRALMRIGDLPAAALASQDECV
jgi:hypothetical protein